MFHTFYLYFTTVSRAEILIEPLSVDVNLQIIILGMLVLYTFDNFSKNYVYVYVSAYAKVKTKTPTMPSSAPSPQYSFWKRISCFTTRVKIRKVSGAVWCIISCLSLKNHVAWKDWFNKGKKRERSITKGYKFSKDVKPFKGNKNSKFTDKAYKIKKSHLGPFQRYLRFVQRKRHSRSLLEVPSTKKWDLQRNFNAVKKISEEKGLPFIDMNQILEEFGFDWETDSRDKGDHLNYSGVKVADYLGKYSGYVRARQQGQRKMRFYLEKDLCKYRRIIKKRSTKNEP